MKKIQVLTLLILIFLFGAFSTFNVNAASDDSIAPSQESSEINDSVKENININELSGFSNVVIFIRFSNEVFYSAPNRFSYYETMYNGIGDNVVSLREYFLEASYNQLDIQSVFGVPNDSIVYYTDSHPRSYYQPYDQTTNPEGYTDDDKTTREHELLKNAIDYVDANHWIPDTVDLDANDDGEIDSISFLVSGEATDWNTMLWPHKWALTTYVLGTGNHLEDAPTINGKYAYNYTFELLGNTRNYDYAVSVGILAHETFHLISATDLYHYYNYDWIDPVGYWGLMDHVNKIPNQMLGYMKYQYGNWIQDVPEITESGSYTLYPMQDSPNNIYRINTGYSSEYIYLEYRNQAGVYESRLPESGLLVYRVDMTYANQGNVNGYYNDGGYTADEVFIFRPGIEDTIPPIEFSTTDNPSIDEDGNIDKAALSNLNEYDEMGLNTDIPMFYSDGTEMEYKIYNLVSHGSIANNDDYLTFDVYMPPEIKLSSSVDLSEINSYSLLDMPGMGYFVNIDNIANGANVYYTIDGTDPNPSSQVYDGTPIQITSAHNQVKIATYMDGQLMSTDSKTYQFTDSVETDHNPYGTYYTKYWYISFADDKEYNVYFDGLTETQSDHDFITIYDGTNTYKYSGTELQDTNLTFNNKGLLIEFSSDFLKDDYYGFAAKFIFDDDYLFVLKGNPTIESEVNENYVDPGVDLIGFNTSNYYVVPSGSVDSDVLGDYEITYDLYDIYDNLIQTLTRDVKVVDSTPPVITLNGDDTVYVELGSSYDELGATFQDNYDTEGDIIIQNGAVKADKVGTYSVYYSITDSSGNISLRVTRTVIVEDTTAPTVTLNPGIDTVYSFDDFIDTGVTVEDKSNTDIVETTENSLTDSNVKVYIYTVTDAYDNVTIVKRIVTINDLYPEVYFDLGPAITTIELGSRYVDGTCAININNVEHACEVQSNNVNQNAVGTYTITYSYTYNETTYTYKRYVFVIDPTPTTELYVPAKREESVI